MNKKILITVFLIIVGLFILSIVANYYDTARVTTGYEPKLVIETYSEKHDAVIYWGLGYKVVRYVNISPQEPYENAIQIKKGSWFMKYQKQEYPDIYVTKVDEGKTFEIHLIKDRAKLINLIENQKYIDEVCEGITDYEIMIDDKEYHLKSGCKGICFENKDAHLSDEDMNEVIEILADSEDLT